MVIFTVMNSCFTSDISPSYSIICWYRNSFMFTLYSWSLGFLAFISFSKDLEDEILFTFLLFIYSLIFKIFSRDYCLSCDHKENEFVKAKWSQLIRIFPIKIWKEETEGRGYNNCLTCLAATRWKKITWTWATRIKKLKKLNGREKRIVAQRMSK